MNFRNLSLLNQFSLTHLFLACFIIIRYSFLFRVYTISNRLQRPVYSKFIFLAFLPEIFLSVFPAKVWFFKNFHLLKGVFAKNERGLGLILKSLFCSLLIFLLFVVYIRVENDWKRLVPAQERRAHKNLKLRYSTQTVIN